MEVEKRLKEALDEQLTKDLEKIPTEEEIKVRHTFNDSFLTYMQQLIYNERRNKKKKRAIKRTYFLRAAACLVCLVGIGTLMFTAFPFGRSDSTDKSSRMEATSESTRSTESTKESSDTGTNSIASDQMQLGIESQREMEDASKTEYFTLTSLSFDGDYHIDVSVNNQIDTEMTYTPIYEWTYTLNGKTTTTSLDIDVEGSKEVLKSGESITETYNLNDYGIKKGGGVLEIKRMINEQETTLSITIE